MMLIAVYLGAIVAANLTVAAFGPSVTIVNAFFLIGLDLTTRDELHERWHGKAAPMLALIATGGLLSWLLNRDAGQIAVASTIAFLAASVVDWSIYAALGDRARWLRVNGSNVGGAAVDSILFPTLAFGGFLPLVTVGQFAAKVIGGAFWYVVLKARHRQLTVPEPEKPGLQKNCPGCKARSIYRLDHDCDAAWDF